MAGKSYKITASSVLLCLMLLTLHVLAEDIPVFEPAAFYDDDRSLKNKINFPDTEGNVKVLIHCDASVEKRGRLDMARCLAKDDTLAEYESAILVATNKVVTMVPAMENGRPVEVWFQFSVFFERNNGVESIQVYPHQFLNFDEYGLDYSGPQRYSSRDSSFPWSLCRQGFVHKVWISMTVDEAGVPGEIEVLDQDNYPDTCAKAAQNYMSQGKYIPAIQNGRPVKAKYLEIFWWKARNNPRLFDRPRLLKESKGSVWIELN